jgi:hypothetical protein
MDDILGINVEPSEPEQETKRRVPKDGDPEQAPKQRRKKGTIRTQNSFSRELNMDENLQFRLERYESKRETMQRKNKGQLNLNEVVVEGFASKALSDQNL